MKIDTPKHVDVHPSAKLTSEQKQEILEDVEKASAYLKEVVNEMRNIVWGQDDILISTLTGIVGGGHILLEGKPGLAKTRLLQNIAPILSIDFARTQFTADMMPADILGSEILQTVVSEDGQSTKQKLVFEMGPIDSQLYMADEINRASPRTQSGLLQAMQEYEISIAGKTYKLPRPFHVVATQNPLEQEGTNPLPEAQLDRFLLKIDIGYPDSESEKKIIEQTTSSKYSKYKALKDLRADGSDLSKREVGGNDVKVKSVLPKDYLVEVQELARILPLSEKFVNAVNNIVRHLRPDDEGAPKIVRENVYFGPGPRAGQAFAQAARARALIDGRLSPDASDIEALADQILSHRMRLHYKSKMGDMTEQKLVMDVVKQELAHY